jgi:glycosyltransferase involved in cell wall biosynthesis
MTSGPEYRQGHGAGVAHFVNSFVGRPGNIGMRTAKVLPQDVRELAPVTCLSRGAEVQTAGVHYLGMGWLGHIPRALNAARIYIAPSFNHRPLDIRLFEAFAQSRIDNAVPPGVAVAHVWDTCPNLITALKARGLKVVLDVPIAPQTYAARLRSQGSADFLLDTPAMIEIELAAFMAADLLLAPSQFVARELALAGVPADRIHVVEFGSDNVVALPDSASRSSISERGLDFVFAGNVSRRKGVIELLAAWTDPALGQHRLHLCGRVFPEVHCAIAASRHGQVLTPGFVDMSAYLPGCDVFVLPSWLEGSAKAVYQAMANGLPAIVTESTGAIVRDGIDGFVIEAGDVAALRDRMRWFSVHPDRVRTMGAAARERVREFTWDRYATRVAELHARLASESQPEAERVCA